MKKFKFIGKYPILSTIVIGTVIFTLGPIIFAIIIAGIVVIPMYLAYQMLEDKQ